MKKNKIKNRLRQAFGRNAIIVGLLAVGFGLLIFKFVTLEWLYQSFQELIGFGLISIIAGFVYIILGKKVDM